MWRFLVLLCTLYFYRSKSAFFKYVRTCSEFSMQDRVRIIDAYEEMEEVFKDVRRESRAPYMTHLHAVAVIVLIYLKSRESDEVIAALFHDLLEDFGDIWSKEKIGKKYGQRVAGYVDGLTKLSHIYCLTKDECDSAYHASFQRAGNSVTCIKLADRFHNNVTLFYRPLAKQLYKIVETLDHYIPLAQRKGILAEELSMSITFARFITLFKRTKKQKSI